MPPIPPYSLPQYLPARPTCEQCELSEDPSYTRGIRSVEIQNSHPPTHPVLVMIAQNPGRQEVVKGLPLVGPVGQVFHDCYLTTPTLHPLARIFLMNAYRCYTPVQITVKKAWIRGCTTHALSDLSAIESAYPQAPKFLVALGAHATTLLNLLNKDLPTTLSNAWAHQGRLATLTPAAHRWSIFWTYHPGALNRDHSRARPIGDHLNLLKETLSGTRRPIPPIVRVPPHSP